MVYKKTRRYKRVRKAKITTVKKLNSKVNRMMSTLKPELKVSESAVNAKLIGTLASPSDFLDMKLPDPNLTTGTSWVNQRIGLKIRIRSISIKGNFHVGSNPSATVRMLLVRAPQGLTYSPSYYLSNTSNALGVISPFEPSVRDEFQVVWDKTVAINPFGADRYNFNFFKKVNFPVSYIGNGTSIANGGLTLFVFSDQPAGSTNPLLNLYARIRYTDI